MEASHRARAPRSGRNSTSSLRKRPPPPQVLYLNMPKGQGNAREPSFRRIRELSPPHRHHTAHPFMRRYTAPLTRQTKRQAVWRGTLEPTAAEAEAAGGPRLGRSPLAAATLHPTHSSRTGERRALRRTRMTPCRSGCVATPAESNSRVGGLARAVQGSVAAMPVSSALCCPPCHTRTEGVERREKGLRQLRRGLSIEVAFTQRI